MAVDIGIVVQGLMVAILVGAGKAIWNASTAITKLDARLDEHLRTDAEFHAEIMAAIPRRRPGR